MVRVPECAFWAGDGSTNSVTGQFSSGPSVHPFRITSEQPLTLGGDTGDALVCRDVGARNPTSVDDFHLDVTQTLPAAFPKGYRAFYCMRHEITQQQYADFLNMLPYAMQSARSSIQASAPPGTPGVCAKGDLGSGRMGIKIVVSGVANASSPVVINRETFVASRTRESPGTPAVYAADEPHVACNYISHIDGSHYAAWAGLRPMTELEFEKACRGPLKPVPNEYAWGTAEIVGQSASNGAYRVRNVGKPDEAAAWEGDGGPDATHGNAALAAFRMEAAPDLKGIGPLRAGIFATPTSDRVSAGASYWGILDLSGNAMERCITIGTAAGRDFTGTHGNGTAFSWKETGFCVRGGGCDHRGNAAWNVVTLRVSDRSFGVKPFHDRRKAAQGFRCARTAP
jgi:formylglycine-generating enzyme required for sulfatase activity